MLAEDLQQPRQQRDAATEQHQADQVERSRGLAAIVGHVASDDEQRGQADRHIDEEDVAPRQPMDDQTADRRAEQRADQRRNDDEVHSAQ